MKFIIVLILVSLSESLRCDTQFDILPRYYGESGTFMLKKDITENIDPKDCKSCLWLVGSDFTRTKKTANYLGLEEAVNKLREEDCFWSLTTWYTVHKDPLLHLQDPKFISDDVCCPADFICTAKISWDGKNEFSLLGLSVTPQSATNKSDDSYWKYELSNDHFFIYHTYLGGSRRKFVFRQFATKTQSTSRIKCTFFSFEKIVKTYINLDPVNVKAEEIGKNGKVTYVASVLGYIDNY